LYIRARECTKHAFRDQKNEKLGDGNGGGDTLPYHPHSQPLPCRPITESRIERPRVLHANTVYSVAGAWVPCVYTICADLRTDANMWTVDVVVQNESCQRAVSTQFQFAPKHFHFTRYRVMLVHGDDHWQRTAQRQKLVHVSEVCSSGSQTSRNSTEFLTRPTCRSPSCWALPRILVSFPSFFSPPYRSQTDHPQTFPHEFSSGAGFYKIGSEI